MKRKQLTEKKWDGKKKDCKKKDCKKNISPVLACAVVMALAFSGCGSAPLKSAAPSAMAGAMASNADAAVAYDAYDEAYYDEPMMVAEAGSSGAILDNSAVQSQLPTDGTRKLIRTVNLTVETQEYDALMATLETRIGELGGYIESMDSSNGSRYNGAHSVRNASLTIRIPKQDVDNFLVCVTDSSNVLRRSENVEDVTLNYVDMKSHKQALQTEYDRLLVLLERAELLEDIIRLEERLAQVRYEIERMESSLRAYDDKVDYGTIYLYIEEVEIYTPVPVKEETVWERISGGFVHSLKNVAEGCVNFFVWFVTRLPYFVLWGAVIAVIVVIIKAVIKKNKKKRQAKKEARLAAQAQLQKNMQNASAMHVPPMPQAQEPQTQEEKKA